MNSVRTLIGILAAIILLAVLAYASGAVYFVKEYQNAVVTRFGEVRYAVVTGFEIGQQSDEQIQTIKKKYPGQVQIGAGLYLKVPFVDNVTYFDSRILFWEGEVKEISTKDLRTLLVDTSARWRILDVIKFFKTLGGEQQALNRLGGVINSNVEDKISQTRLIEAVRNENLTLETRVKKRLQTVDEEEGVEAAKIRYGRKQLIQKIEQPTSEQLWERFGIQLVDIMITQLNYTESVRKQVYDRMISERKRIAARYRAQGQQQKREILGEVQKQKQQLISGAQRQVQEILGRAESRAIKIWADAYQQDRDFYQFHRSLMSYENSMDTNATFLLSDQNQMLRFVSGPRP